MISTTIETVNTGLKERISKVERLVGKTPLYEFTNVFHKPGVRVFAKLEWQQFGGSVKSRPAFSIFKHGIRTKKLKGGKHLLDATSGNTGIAYATIGAALGIPVTLCLPENASTERKQILQALGVEVIYTSRFESTDGSQRRAREVFRENPEKYFYANQYGNVNNWKAHFETTAVEIWQQTHHKITHFVAGLGTTGTFVGTSRGLKKFNPKIQVTALQPNNPMHGLEGWKHLETAIVPKIYDRGLADRFLEIDTPESYEMVKRIAQKEGLLVSPSSAANLLGAIKLAEEIEEGVIVTTFADNAEKYSETMKEIFC